MTERSSQSAGLQMRIQGHEFADIAEGDFQSGLNRLENDPWWCDKESSLDGPFYFGLPNPRFPGWGEGLLFASLLRRKASGSGVIRGFARPGAAYILNMDPTFSIDAVENFDEARSEGGRSPLAIVKSALTADLLNHAFEPLRPNLNENAECEGIGIAWASLKRNGMPNRTKSVDFERFLKILPDRSVRIISLQRHIKDEQEKRLRDHFYDLHLVNKDAIDCRSKGGAAEVVEHIMRLKCMLTVSTTTAHIAASLGVPVIVLAKKRKGPQWFWRVQAEHERLFYPTAKVVPGEGAEWWRNCLVPARAHLVAALG